MNTQFPVQRTSQHVWPYPYYNLDIIYIRLATPGCPALCKAAT